MLSPRRPLAPLADPQQLTLSPLKGLSLADKENTVSRARGRAGAAGAGAAGPGLPLTARLPAAPEPQWRPRAGQQDRAEDLPGAGRAGERGWAGAGGRRAPGGGGGGEGAGG